jgi:hypothetical protein
MKPEEKQRHIIKLIAIGKLFSEYSTHLIGELKMKPKQDFNSAVKSVDKMVNSITHQFNEEQKEVLESMGDSLYVIFDEIKTI